MQKLMRALRLSKEREREKIYTSSLPDFRAFARPYQNGSLIELMQLAGEFEELVRDREKLWQQSRSNRPRLMAVEDAGPAETKGPCTRCIDNARSRPQLIPTLHRRLEDAETRDTGRGNVKTRVFCSVGYVVELKFAQVNVADRKTIGDVQFPGASGCR